MSEWLTHRKTISKSAKETQKISKIMAGEFVKHRVFNKALVVALEGELGSGKTTFSQGLAKALGIKEKVLSPTFVLVKIYKVTSRQAQRIKLKHLIHIDCYRLDSPTDLLHLGFKDFLKDRDAILVIEWASKIKSILPKNTIWIRFKHGAKSSIRILYI